MTIVSTPTAPLVVVVGATGNQGGSVIRALADSDKPYRIRGLTRDDTKPAAQKLAALGVEIVVVDLDVNNVFPVRKTFVGASYAFVVTNFWEHLERPRESAEGKMLMSAAKSAGVKLLIWSGLQSVYEGSKRKYRNVGHHEGKAEVTAFARKSGVPLTVLMAGWYATNHSGFPAFTPKKAEDGSYVLGLPISEDTVVPVLDCASDYGLFARRAIESENQTLFGPGTEVVASGEDISFKDMISQLSEITGKKITYQRITDEEFMAATKLPSTTALDLLETMKYFEEFGYVTNYNEVKPNREDLARTPKTWADFVRENDWSSVLE